MTRGIVPNKNSGTARVAEDQAERSFASMLRIDPADNMLVGGETICRYLAISSMNTLHRWVELYAFPAIKRPDGVWMSSMTSIDQWIFLAAEINNENLERSPGLNTGAHLALERLQRQLEDPDRFAQKRRASAMRAARGVGLSPGRKEPKSPYKSGRDSFEHRAASVDAVEVGMSDVADDGADGVSDASA